MVFSLNNWNSKKRKEIVGIHTIFALLFKVQMARISSCGTKWDNENTNSHLYELHSPNLNKLLDTCSTQLTTQINCEVSSLGNRYIPDIKVFRHQRTLRKENGIIREKTGGGAVFLAHEWLRSKFKPYYVISPLQPHPHLLSWWVDPLVMNE